MQHNTLQGTENMNVNLTESSPSPTSHASGQSTSWRITKVTPRQRLTTRPGLCGKRLGGIFSLWKRFKFSTLFLEITSFVHLLIKSICLSIIIYLLEKLSIIRGYCIMYTGMT